MIGSDDLDERLAGLGRRWPVGSMVDDVMSRIEAQTPRRAPRRRRLLAGLAASGLAASVLLAWLLVVSQPRSLLASVQDDVKRAASAHLMITAWNDRGEASPVHHIWYRRGQGLRLDGPDRVIVEDGTIQWSWPVGRGAGETVVMRRRSPGFFTTGIAANLALPDIRIDWSKFRSPELDRAIDGRACRGFTLPLSELDRVPPGARPVDGQERRVLLLAGADDRIASITIERRPVGGDWSREREIRIDYDAPVPAEKVAARLPDGARVVDCDRAFESLYPLDRALHRVELGGLVLAVHDVQPLRDREGTYVVSSVRGTPEFLRQYPPRRRPINPEVSVLDVASQPMSNGMYGGKYDLIVLGNVSREGVEYSWWAVVPRRFFQMKDGKRDYLPESDTSAMPGEPGRLDDLPGKARVPLSAVYRDEAHRDARGVQQEVSTWAVVPVPADRPLASWEEVAARARHDLQIMALGGAGGLMGVAATAPPAGRELRPLSGFAPESISDADFAAAVLRGLEDLRQFDQVGDVLIGGPPGLQPGGEKK